MKILTALPIYNEAAYVNSVLRAVKRHTDRILVVDDGSTDSTADRLKLHSGITVLTHRVNRGYGQSLIHAFGFAEQNGYDWIITIDCDKQHEPDYIPCFLREIMENHSDIVSGSRYLQATKRNTSQPPPERVQINRAITAMLNSRLHFRLTDAFCGFKAYRVEALQQLHLSEPGYGLPLQLWVQAAYCHLEIKEIPVPLIYHDPKRNFQGVLEDPQKRLRYYLSVLEREMETNVAQVTA